MPIDNLGKTHFTDEQQQKISDAIKSITQVVNSFSNKLTAAERSKYGKVGEQKKLLINKVKDIHSSQPGLSSPEVDWEEFAKDYADRQFAENALMQLESLTKTMLSIRILRDHDNYMDALRDYRYAQYKNGFANQHGYSNKIDAIKVFFPKTGKKKKKD